MYTFIAFSLLFGVIINGAHRKCSDGARWCGVRCYNPDNNDYLAYSCGTNCNAAKACYKGNQLCISEGKATCYDPTTMECINYTTPRAAVFNLWVTTQIWVTGLNGWVTRVAWVILGHERFLWVTLGRVVLSSLSMFKMRGV